MKKILSFQPILIDKIPSLIAHSGPAEMLKILKTQPINGYMKHSSGIINVLEKPSESAAPCVYLPYIQGAITIAKINLGEETHFLTDPLSGCSLFYFQEGQFVYFLHDNYTAFSFDESFFFR